MHRRAGALDFWICFLGCPYSWSPVSFFINFFSLPNLHAPQQRFARLFSSCPTYLCFPPALKLSAHTLFHFFYKHLLREQWPCRRPGPGARKAETSSLQAGLPAISENICLFAAIELRIHSVSSIFWLLWKLAYFWADEKCGSLSAMIHAGRVGLCKAGEADNLALRQSGGKDYLDEMRVGVMTFSRELACASEASAAPHRSWIASPAGTNVHGTREEGFIGCGPSAMRAAGQKLSSAD